MKTAMHHTPNWLAAVIGVLIAAGATAQPVTVTTNTPTSANLYAQQIINLEPGFEATTGGFEAKIKLLESVAGRWSVPLLWTTYQRYLNTPPNDIPAGYTQNSVTGMIGIHTHVTPDGNVLSWEGHNDNTVSSHVSHVYTWNPNLYARNGNQVYPMLYAHYDNFDSNIFCSGHSFLTDGRLLVAGGHYSDGSTPALMPTDATQNGAGPGYIGLSDVNIYNYKGSIVNGSNYVWQTQNNSFTPAMSARRWYPTSTTLADGKVVVVSGQKWADANGNSIQGPPEVYNPTTNSWQVLSNAARMLPLYPWMFLAPDGRVFNAGPNPDAKFLNPTTTAIATTAAGTWDATTYNTQLGLRREYGSAAMYAPGKILVLGGSSNVGVTKTAELIDINTAATAQFRTAAPMTFARTHVNATILPDGSVLATGGTRTKTASDADAVLYAELWQPGNKYTPGGTWTLMAEMSRPRLYHSTAVLLPDATVLTTGGGQGGGYTDHPDYQIFTPPYLCKGLPRPQISSAPKAVAYGQTFTITGPQTNSFLPYGRVTLVRLSSVTHAFNMNQRFLELTPTAGPASNQLTLTAPNNPNTCPPGHYMLFLVDGNGTPSHASIIAINTSACSSPLTITQVPPIMTSNQECSRTTQFTVSGGPAGSAYDWTVNGTAFGSQPGQTTIDLTTSTSAPTVQVTVNVRGNIDCGATSTLTSYFPGCQP
jgi:hypothetical protein